MLESITVFKTVVKGCGDQLEQPVTLKEIVDAYNFDAMKKGLSSIGEEDIGDKPVMPVALGLYRFHIKAASVKVWVVKAPNKTPAEPGMLESITIYRATVKQSWGDLVQPVTLMEAVDAYNREAVAKGRSCVMAEAVVNFKEPTRVGVHYIRTGTGGRCELWVVETSDHNPIAPLAQRLDNESLTYRNHQNDVEQGLCNKDAEFSKGMTVYVWNDNPQLATLRTLDDYDPLSSYPYKINLYGASVVFQHACPKEDGHPARDLIKELRSLFPKEQYGSSVLNLGQAAILLRWASSLPVVFRDGTEEVVRMSIQDGVIVIEQA